ncbi:TIGR03016 family PEP-CTERM system-associated outer membrane protein [Roseomonas alba]|uniref:TIGR03016 family PEP-CTERM system-associated outer membrane protein n=1 Tax=Roseomonas alba TaxID=2846776 RepID=UPI001CA5072A
MLRVEVKCITGFGAALLLGTPAMAQTAGGAVGASGATPAAATAPASADPAAPAATVALTSPALGSLADRSVPRTPDYLDATGPRSYIMSPGEIGQLGIAQQPLALGSRPYALGAAIAVDVAGTNNVFQTRHDARSDIFTTITPSVSAVVGTTRLVGALSYAPSLNLYSTYTSQNALYQIGSGQLLAAVVPGLFYVDIRGAASVVPQTGGFIPGSGQVISSQGATQTFSAQITPFLVHRFGSAATGQLGYSYLYSEQDWANGQASGTGFEPQSYSGHRGFAVLRSGEDLGRLALQARVDGTMFVGTGVYDNAHRFISSVEARYSILPTVALLGEVGYESIEYGGTNPGTIDGATWSVGARLTPGPDSIAVIRYGRHEGFNSLSLNVGVALGVRTNLYATYSEALSTALSQTQDLLSTTTFDALGNPVDSQSGAPVILINSFLGVSTTLYRLRTGTASIQHQWPRDVFTLSGTWQDGEPISSAPGEPSSPQRGGYATFSWGHELTARTTTAVSVQYGRIAKNQVSSDEGNVYAARLILTHRLSENLIASAQVAWVRETYPSQSDLGYSQGVIRAGLRRTF